MKNFLLCIGGTGARIGEAFVHLAATGFMGLDREGHEGSTEIWLIDKDEKCANGILLDKAVKDYNAAKARCGWKNQECLNHGLDFKRWDFSPSLNQLSGRETGGDCSFASLQNGDKSNMLSSVMNLLHDVSSQESSMDGGFYGRSQTGAALFNAMAKTKAFRNKETNPLYDELEKAINMGETRVFLVGSSFGATGASMLPNLAENIRKEMKEKGGASNLHIGAVMMLPYFSYEKPEAGVTQRVAPETHWEKASEALKYYGKSVKIRKENEELGEKETVFDAFYLVGLEPLVSINSEFADKGMKQKNDPHIAELFAAMSVKNFYDLKPNPESHNPAIYAYKLTSGLNQFDWSRLHENLKGPMLDFTRFCVSTLTFLHPLTCQKNLLTNDTFGKCFGGTKGMWGDYKKVNIDPEELKANVKSMAEYARDFLAYVQTISAVGPDVVLFDKDYLNNVCAGLLAFAPVQGKSFRDTTLATEYSEGDRRDLMRLCTPKRIVAMIDKDKIVSSQAMSVMEETQNYMKKEKFDKEAVAKTTEGMKTHTNEGLKRIYSFLYENYRTRNDVQRVQN